MRRGLYVFEGIDGSGKTSTMNKVDELLESCPFPVITTREPTPWATRRLVEVEGASPLESLLIFMQDRVRHSIEMNEYLEKGNVVLCDRYYYSTVAYQSFTLTRAGVFPSVECARERLKNMANLGALNPAAVFWLTCNLELAASRVSSRHSSSMYEVPEIQRSCDETYQYMYQRHYGGHWIKLCSDTDQDALAADIANIIKVIEWDGSHKQTLTSQEKN